MKPNVNTGGRLRSGLLPVDYFGNKGGSGGMSGPFTPGQPNVQTPKSRVSTGTTPPTAVSGSVGYDNAVANVSGGKNEYGSANDQPIKSPGQVPPTGAARRPATRTSPTDKSKSAGVE